MLLAARGGVGDRSGDARGQFGRRKADEERKRREKEAAADAKRRAQVAAAAEAERHAENERKRREEEEAETKRRAEEEERRRAEEEAKRQGAGEKPKPGMPKWILGGAAVLAVVWGAIIVWSSRSRRRFPLSPAKRSGRYRPVRQGSPRSRHPAMPARRQLRVRRSRRRTLRMTRSLIANTKTAPLDKLPFTIASVLEANPLLPGRC